LPADKRVPRSRISGSNRRLRELVSACKRLRALRQAAPGGVAAQVSLQHLAQAAVQQREQCVGLVQQRAQGAVAHFAVWGSLRLDNLRRSASQPPVTGPLPALFVRTRLNQRSGSQGRKAWRCSVALRLSSGAAPKKVPLSEASASANPEAAWGQTRRGSA